MTHIKLLKRYIAHLPLATDHKNMLSTIFPRAESFMCVHIKAGDSPPAVPPASLPHHIVQKYFCAKRGARLVWGFTHTPKTIVMKISASFHNSPLLIPYKKGKTQLVGGFTLVELLVIISIISLLSSVVFASVNSARPNHEYNGLENSDSKT